MDIETIKVLLLSKYKKEELTYWDVYTSISAMETVKLIDRKEVINLTREVREWYLNLRRNK